MMMLFDKARSSPALGSLTGVANKFSSLFVNRSCPWGLGRKQLKIEPLHITVRYHLHHFVWMNPFEILNVILPACLRSSHWPLQVKLVWEV